MECTIFTWVFYLDHTSNKVFANVFFVSFNSGITNSSGTASITVSNISSETTFTASYGGATATCTVTTQTIIFDDSTEYTQTLTPSGDTRANIIPTFNFDASVDFEMTCDVYFSKDGSAFGLFPSNNPTQFAYHLTYGQISNYAAIYYGNSNGGESSVKVYGTQSFGVWFNLKFVKEGYQVTTYINNTLFSSTIPTTTLKPYQEQTIFAYQLYSNTDKVRYDSAGKIHLISTTTTGSANVYATFYLPIY